MYPVRLSKGLEPPVEVGFGLFEQRASSSVQNIALKPD
jgi:hypothetical protein